MPLSDLCSTRESMAIGAASLSNIIRPERVSKGAMYKEAGAISLLRRELRRG
jgi:hypothetical protein